MIRAVISLFHKLTYQQKEKGVKYHLRGTIDNYKYLCPFQKTPEKITEK